MAKLFEYMLLLRRSAFFRDDPLQFGFKKHSVWCHALFTFKHV